VWPSNQLLREIENLGAFCRCRRGCCRQQMALPGFQRPTSTRCHHREGSQRRGETDLRIVTHSPRTTIRELGPVAADIPPFPLPSTALAPLRSKSEPSGSTDFMPMWCGQAARLGRELAAGELTQRLAEETLARL
jgi:hypothetical protein